MVWGLHIDPHTRTVLVVKYRTPYAHAVGGTVDVSGQYVSTLDYKLTLTSIFKPLLVCFIGHSRKRLHCWHQFNGDSPHLNLYIYQYAILYGACFVNDNHRTLLALTQRQYSILSYM